MSLEFVKDLPDYYYSDDIRDCCEHGFRKSMCPIKCSHFVRIKQDLQDLQDPTGDFIADRIVKCDETSMPLTERVLKVCFREWMKNTYPGHRINLPELYELITKRFGKQEAKGWLGIRMYEDHVDDGIDWDLESTNLIVVKTIKMNIELNAYEPKICQPCILCEHGKCNKSYCKDCVRISRLCEHIKYKSYCKVCVRISQLCEHGKCKSFCKICDGSKLCRSSWCHTTGNKKYEGYCVPCFVNNPENMLKPAMRNHKTKEKEVVDCVIENYPQFTWVADRKVQDGCSRRRPDLLLDMGSHIIIIEIDENKHSGYDCSCENKRLMEISQDLQHRSIVFIRFNPDSYRDQEGMLIKSCWQLNTRGVMTIILSKRNEWNERMRILNQQIHHWIDNIPEKMVEIVELFY
jgi:hypothetical protein